MFGKFLIIKALCSYGMSKDQAEKLYTVLEKYMKDKNIKKAEDFKPADFENILKELGLNQNQMKEAIKMLNNMKLPK